MPDDNVPLALTIARTISARRNHPIATDNLVVPTAVLKIGHTIIRKSEYASNMFDTKNQSRLI